MTDRQYEKLVANLNMEVAERRMEAAEKRGDKFDLQLQRTRVVVEVGMKAVLQLAKSQRELEKSQKAFIDSLRRAGGNGHRHG